MLMTVIMMTMVMIIIVMMIIIMMMTMIWKSTFSSSPLQCISFQIPLLLVVFEAYSLSASAMSKQNELSEMCFDCIHVIFYYLLGFLTSLNAEKIPIEHFLVLRVVSPHYNSFQIVRFILKILFFIFPTVSSHCFAFF